jgi:hypothetical protein
MSDKTDTDSIRFSQVLAGALAAVTAAVLGSTMGVAGTVVGAGLASIVTTVGGALYLRSIQRTKQGVRSVRNKVVTRAGGTTVTLVDEEPEDQPDEQPQTGHRLRWPAVVVGSVLAFVLGMMAVTGVEWLRGESLSGGEGTTVGGIVRSGPGGGDDHDKAPPATRESTTPNTGPSTVTVTQTPLTSGNEEPTDPPNESGQPTTTTPDTSSSGHGNDSATPPTSGEPG